MLRPALCVIYQPTRQSYCNRNDSYCNRRNSRCKRSDNRYRNSNDRRCNGNTISTTTSKPQHNMPRPYLLLLALIPLPSLAQTTDDSAEDLMQFYESTSDDEEALYSAYDNTIELQQQPLDVNQASVDDLMLIPGMDRLTAEKIISRRTTYGPFKSIEELRAIEGIPPQLMTLMCTTLQVPHEQSAPWYTADGLRELLRTTKHELTFTATQPTYYRAADMHAPTVINGEENRYAGQYLGGRMRHSLRYNLTAGTHLKVNITGANTSGEPFFRKGNNWGYDSWSWNITLRDLACLRTLIVGQYRAQFGMGLILNNNFTMGKQAMLASTSRQSTAITPHSSTSDSKHLQGAAALLSFGRVNVTFFGSYRHIDATLNADSTISTILTSGYHRTATEMAKKNNTIQTTAGAHAGYSHTTRYGLAYSVGISGLYTHLSRDINPVYSSDGTISDSRRYRRYYATGNTFYNASVDYSLNYGPFHFTGETAINDQAALATINSLIFSRLKNLTLNVSQRFYAYNYYSLYGSALNEGGAVQNESAVLLGATWKPKRTLTVEAYTDIAYFPWYKYRVSNSSYAWDNTVKATYNRRLWTLSARYRYKLRQKDQSTTDSEGNTSTQVADKINHRISLTASYKNKRWSTRSNVEGIMTSSDSNGIIASQSVRYKPLRGLSLYVSGAYFHTDDYDSRLYAYEQGMRYTFSYSSYYGHGMRLSAMCSVSPLRWMDVRGKIGYTNYFDRSQISSAQRMINASHTMDVDMQIVIKV